MAYDALDDISGQFGQIREVLQTMTARLLEIGEHMEQQNFTMRQIAPILSGTRTDIVQMRATLLRLADGIERVLNQMPDEVKQVNAPPRLEAPDG